MSASLSTTSHSLKVTKRICLFPFNLIAIIMVRWYIAYLIVFAAVQFGSSTTKLHSDVEGNLRGFFSDLLQKLEELKETNSQNTASLKRQLCEQTLAIQKLELKQNDIEGILSKWPSLEEIKETGINNGKVLQQLSETVQQLQTRLSKIEQTLDRNVLGMRLLLTSSPLNLGEKLLSAVKNDDVQQVLLLLELGADIEFQDDKKNRPIHVAVENSRPRILEILLENMVDIESHGEYQKTALHLSGYSGCFECTKILVDRGASLESLDQWRNTPIIHPARVGFNEFVELLLQKGANVNAAQMQGWTGLHFAAKDGPLSTVKILVENGADVHLKNENGHTPLDIAINKKRYLIADFLQKL